MASLSAPRVMKAARLLAAAARSTQPTVARSLSTGPPTPLDFQKIRPARIVGLSGSARAGSFNTKLLARAMELASEVADTETVDVAALPLPLYNGDLEEASGLPENAIAIKKTLQAADGIIIASPEYNGSMTPLLSNLLAWCSRPHEDGEAMYSAFKGKVVGLVSTSPGNLGGLRGLVHTRDLLGNLMANVVAEQVAVGGSFKAFNEDGSLAIEAQEAMLRSAVHQVNILASSLANREVQCELYRAQRTCAEYGNVIIH